MTANAVRSVPSGRRRKSSATPSSSPDPRTGGPAEKSSPSFSGAGKPPARPVAPTTRSCGKSFKAASDEFHQRRARHFAEVARIAEAKATAKQQLIAEAEKLSSISDYELAKGQFSDIMTRWRETGHAGRHENELWTQFVNARQAMYNATAEDRRGRQSEYVQRVEARIIGHREMIGKLKAQRREIALAPKGTDAGLGRTRKWPKNSTHEPKRSIGTSKNVNAGSTRTPSEWLARWLVRTR